MQEVLEKKIIFNWNHQTIMDIMECLSKGTPIFMLIKFATTFLIKAVSPINHSKKLTDNQEWNTKTKYCLEP